MNILCVVKWLKNGGAEKNAINIVNYFSNCNEIDLIVLSEESMDLYGDISDKVKNITFISGYIDLVKFLLKNKSYSLAFAGDHRIGAILSGLKLFNVVKMPIVSRCINNLTLLLKNKSFFSKLIFSFLLRHIDLVVCQCDAMKFDLIDNWRVDSNNLVTIYNPIEKIDLSCRELKNPTNEKFEYVFVGRFSCQKNIPLLVDSFNLLKDRLNNISLKLVGYRHWMDEDQTVYNELIDIIERNKLERYVSIVPYSSDTKSILASSDCFVLSSFFEGFPNVLIEANSVGVPVVSVDCSFGPAEIINEHNGILVKNYNSSEFADAMYSAYYKQWDKLKIIQTCEIYSKGFQYDKLNLLIHELIK